MRVKDGAFLLSAAGLLVAAGGCTGAGPKTIAHKPVASAAQAAQAHEPRIAPEPADIAASNPAGDEPATTADDEPALPRDAPAELSPPDSPANGTPAKRTNALIPPTVRPAEMPQVVLSAAHAKDCFIGVGDKFPDFRLPDLMSRMRELRDVQGDALTVVVFWSEDRLLAADQLRYLDEHIARYADLGVKAVAVNVGESLAEARRTVDAAEVAVPVLLDLERRLFSRVGQGHLPRTYLLDREGRVLWFDIEFSRHTREQLEQAIHASLQST